jgi:cell wall-associated NlpC family hydrolase
VDVVLQNPARFAGVPDYARFAATSILAGQRRVCSGRLAMPQAPHADAMDPTCLLNPTRYSWERPENLPRDVRRGFWGECCVNYRHFDCLGFVTWVFWKSMGEHFPRNFLTKTVAEWQSDCRTFTGPLQIGDVLFDDGLQHVGIVVSPTEVAHAAGYRWGVQRTLCDRRDRPIYPSSLGAWEVGTGRWASRRRPRWMT